MRRCPALFIFALAAALYSAGELRAQDQIWRQRHDSGQAALDRGEPLKADDQWKAELNEAQQLGPQSPRFSESLRDLAGLYALMWRFDEGASTLAGANALPSNDPAAPLDLLRISGMLNAGRSNLTQADKDLDAAVRRATSTYGDDHPKTAVFCSELGEVRLREEDFARSQDMLRRAVGLFSESYGSRYIGTVEARRRYAMLLMALGRYSDAAAQAKRAVDTARQLGPGARLALADAELALGLIDTAARRFDNAAQLLPDALNTAQTAFGANSLKALPFFTAMAEWSLDTGNAATAQPLIGQALNLRSIYPPNWLPAAEALLVAARTASQLHQASEAATYIKDALDIASQVKPDSLLVARILEARADIALSANDLTKAEADYRQAEALRERKLTPGNPDVARSLADLAEVYRRRGNVSDAEQFYQRAIKNIEAETGNDSFSLIPALTSYQSFLRQQRRDQEARDLDARLGRLLGRQD